jgi:putative endopeptidase
MNYKLAITLGVLVGLYGCQQESDQTELAHKAEAKPAPAPVEVAPVELVSGIDREGFNESIRPQDDFFDYVNGGWIESTKMPSDRARWGTFDALVDQSSADIRALVEEVSESTDVQDGSPTQKIRDYYNSYMDLETATKLGADPISSELSEISAAKSLDDIYRLFSTLDVYGVDSPIGVGIGTDDKDSNTTVVFLTQAGLTMPDRDYYLEDGEQYVKGRRLYLEYVEGIFSQAGIDDGATRAKRLLALETRLAEVQWTREERRDPVKIYNPMSPAELQEMAPKINWDINLEAAGVGGRDLYIVSHPSFFEATDDIIAETDLGTWKDYLTFQTLSNFAPVLGEDYFNLWFAFNREGLSGISEPRPLWKRAVASVNGNMGELMGQLYVDRHFQPEAKARMDTLISNLIRAYEKSIKELDWMSEETKQQALVKLSKFNPKIGYTDNWRDYSKLEIIAGDLVGNIKRADEFENNRQLDKLDSPVDKGEWGLTPQTVNAYYNPSWNEIVFPAAILQPPFFNLDADDAVNYGGIGAVIGHEIGHGFDDQGRQYDGDGNLNDWWTEDDAVKFEERKNALAAQYDGYEVIDGLTVNGQFTSGENIGDLGGLSIAYLAYKMSLEGKESAVIDGWTGEQRLFLGWAQVWRIKARDAETKRLLTIDPHAPGKFRVIGASVNIPAFYEAFDVKEGDGMYLAPEDRVRIW